MNQEGEFQDGPEVPDIHALVLTPLTSARRGARIFIFYSLAILMTGAVSVLFADLLWRTGWSGSRTLLLLTFALLFFFSAVGFLHAVYGFVLRRVRGKHSHNWKALTPQTIRPETTTAIAFPIYNEDVKRTYAGLRVTYESLERAGQIDRFDFFILSDSTDPEKWIEEEREWQKLIQQTGTLGRIYYRRRVNNEGKKSGNINDFLNAWGQRYRYMIIFDADSLMRGHTIVKLVNVMESNPNVGLIQTVPGTVNSQSLFGRMQQFANRFYAPIFIRGLDYWSEGCANYWGHNAIIRTETFIKYCALPKLPGRKPFGGHILSHDFVEAALMLKEGAHVWLAHGLEGSYEESPQGLIENAQRDRRWCQGNLQHTMLLFARGLRGVNRIHLLQGIFGYLSSPLWLIFLLTFYWIWMVKNISGLSNIAVHSWMSQLNLSAGQHALLIFMICISVLLIPRVLSILDAMFDLQRLRAFGGIIHICVSTVVETLFSTLHAPLQMLWHTQFVLTILMGKGVDWGRQTREADGTSWAYALRNQWWQTVLGLIWGGSLYYYAPEAFWWFLPICTGLVLAVPLSVFTSRRSWGAATCRLGLFLTPEETSPPPILSVLRMITAPGQKPEEPAEELLPAPNLIESIVDPYINAIHVSLLRENKLDPDAAEARARTMPEASQLRALAEKLLTQGFDALNGPERSVLLSDADTVSWLHRQVWLRSEATLASTWRAAMRRCGV